jgi:Ni/Co efflux regulator RcnB
MSAEEAAQMKTSRLVVAVLSATLVALPVAAQNTGHGRGNDKSDKGGPQNAGRDGPGQGRGQGQDKDRGPGNAGQANGAGNGAQANGPQPAAAPAVVVTDRDRNAIYGYYRPIYAAGNCPPGLAKKNNGCQPPGQAKKLWAIGQPLPAGITFYPLPGALLGQLSPAPAGYQYVRVANDILMMAIGTRLIAGAIADLGSMGAM